MEKEEVFTGGVCVRCAEVYRDVLYAKTEAYGKAANSGYKFYINSLGSRAKV